MNLTMGKSVRESFGEALAALGGELSDVVVVDGDVGNSTRTELFAKKYANHKTVQGRKRLFVNDQMWWN